MKAELTLILINNSSLQPPLGTQCRAQAWALRAHPDIVSGIAAQKCDYKRFQLLPLGLEGPSKNNPEFLEVEEDKIANGP